MVDHIQHVPTEPIGSFLDYTYCGSSNCQNECGRKMTESVKNAVDKMPYARVAYSKFCGEDESNE